MTPVSWAVRKPKSVPGGAMAEQRVGRLQLPRHQREAVGSEHMRAAGRDTTAARASSGPSALAG
jgi:hypothetical protein